MACRTIYVEIMSLQLDGLLDAEDERQLLAHIGACAECTALWGPMNEAHAMLIASARQPSEAPQGFSLRVMARIAATPVVRPQFDIQAGPAYVVPAGLSVLPRAMTAAIDHDSMPVHIPDYVHEWQHRIATYVRGMAAVGMALAATAAVLVTLVLTGALPVSAPVAPAVEMARTLLAAGGTWISSLVQGIGANTLLGGGLVLGLLGLAGWQLVSNYHQAAADFHTDNAVLEAA
jgi:anti-sigma factor RsiW